MAGAVSGPPPTSDIQPHTRPIAWLVLPLGVIWLTIVFMAVQSLLSPIICSGQLPYCSAGNRLAFIPATGGLTFSS